MPPQKKKVFKIVPKGTFAKRAAAKAKAKKAVVTRRPATQLVARPIQAGPGMTSFSAFKGPHRALQKRANVSALGSRNCYVVNVPYQLGVSAGTQSSLTIGTWFSVADVFNMSKKVPSPAGGTLEPTLTQPTMFHLHGLQASVDLCNMSSGSCVVDIYDIVAKQDIPNNEATTDGYEVYTPLVAWSTGMRHQGVGVIAGVPPENQLGSLPTDSQLFNDYYQIKSRKTVLLGQNGLHNHKVTMSPNYTLDVNKAQVAVEYLAGLKGLTHFTMIVSRGQVAKDVTTDLEGTTTGNLVVRAVSLERYTYSWLQASGKQWLNYTQVSAPDSANVRIMNTNNPSPGLVDTI